MKLKKLKLNKPHSAVVLNDPQMKNIRGGYGYLYCFVCKEDPNPITGSIKADTMDEFWAKFGDKCPAGGMVFSCP